MRDIRVWVSPDLEEGCPAARLRDGIADVCDHHPTAKIYADLDRTPTSLLSVRVDSALVGFLCLITGRYKPVLTRLKGQPDNAERP